MKLKKRDIKAWFIKLERRQKQPHITPAEQMTEHTCKHCDHIYKGNFCPRCSLPAKWNGLSYKSVLTGFLDVWGMGNRPMMRTIKDLFWRPGYMIRDYIAGHHLNYFPPFKMLAVFCVLLAATFFIFNIQADYDNFILNTIKEMRKEELSKGANLLLGHIENITLFFTSHSLYRYIIMNVFVVIACRAVYRKVRPHNERNPYNMVETFLGQIYINVQFLIINIVFIFITWHKGNGDLFPYGTPFWITLPVLMYDFHQLYGLSYKATFWRIIRISLLLLLLYTITTILVVVAYTFLSALFE